MGAKGLRTKRKLIESTVRLLSETPLRDIKVFDIASAAETSAATFYVYFDNVIDVVLAAASELSQSTPEILALIDAPWTATTSEAKAHAFVETYVEFWAAHRSLLRTRNLAAEEGDMRFTEVRETAVRPLIQSLVRQIEDGKATGRVAAAVLPYAATGTLLMMLERLGALGHAYDNGGRVTQADLVQAAAHIVASVLGWRTGDGTVAS